MFALSGLPASLLDASLDDFHSQTTGWFGVSS